MGSEIAQRDGELEAYYSQFFNRSAVLKLHDQYKAVYNELYTRADTLYASMQTLSASIQARSATYVVGLISLVLILPRLIRVLGKRIYITKPI